MRRALVVATLLLGLALGTRAHSTEPGCRWWPWSWPWSTPHPPCACCPDDYGRKPMPPCPPRVVSHTPEDYRPKTLPCVSPVKCFGKDDYCSKPCRIELAPCSPPWYTCGPGKNCSALRSYQP